MSAVRTKTFVTGCLLAITLTFSSCGGDDPALDETVDFKDTNLKAKVCEALAKPKGINLTRRDLAKLVNLEASESKISNLTGFEYATNLTELRFRGNKIGNVVRLAKLTKLTHLDLAANVIADVAPLAQLTNLTYLDLSENRIVDVAPLAKLTNLSRLILLDAGAVGEASRAMLQNALPKCSIQFE